MNEEKLSQLREFDRKHVWHPYAALPAQVPTFLVESARGCELTLANGQVLLDGMSSWWSTIHGYNHPALNLALESQIKKMSHVMFGGLTHEPAIELAELLIRITPPKLDYVFFADSGSVAVEVAMKMALQYWLGKKQKYKTKFLTLKGGYHGDTFATMSVCDPVNGMHHLFKNNLTQQLFADVPEPKFGETCEAKHLENIKTLCKQYKQDIAAIILEPIVQGAGGMRFYSADYLKAVRELCDEYDLLLITDEIATGFGRTGKLFACEHANISPDILCMGKALTGGMMTLAATLCNEKVAADIHRSDANVLMHGPTFMANPLACAVAKASVELLIQQDWREEIYRIENALKEGLEPAKQLSNVQDVRCLGAIGVIELKEAVDMQTIQPAIVEMGVWLRPFGKLIYSMPPYIMNDEQLKKLTSAMCKTAALAS